LYSTARPGRGESGESAAISMLDFRRFLVLPSASLSESSLPFRSSASCGMSQNRRSASAQNRNGTPSVPAP